MKSDINAGFLLIKTMLLKPILAGTTENAEDVEKRSTIVLNLMAVVLIILVASVGGYFYFLKPSALFLIGVPIETLGFLSVIFLNRSKQYYNANLLMLVTNAIFIGYWSTVLGPAISLELLLAFITVITFYLASAFILYKKSKILLLCIAGCLGVGAYMILNSYYNFVAPLEINRNITIIMRWSTSIVLLIFILGLLMSYTTQINSLLHEARRLKAISDRKSIFLQDTFHEVRTPINAVFSIAQLLKLDKQPAQNEDLYNSLYDSCYITRNIINNVLEMSRIESGKFYTVKKENISFGNCLKRCVAANGYIASSRGIRINHTISPLLMHNPIYSDELILTKILNNLLGNAVKFSKGESEIQVDCTADNNVLIIKVTNEGVIDPNITDKLFGRFVTENKNGTGTGLGLAITKDLAQHLGGQVALMPDSTGAEKVTIVCELPYEPAIACKQNTPGTQLRRNTFYGARVLLVEDDLLGASLLQKFLKGLGINPVICTNGATVIDKIRAERPHVIISDLSMEGFHGAALVKFVKSDPELKSIPILIISGDAFSKEEILNTGAAGFLLKPVHFDDLYMALAPLLPNHTLS
ncbi:hypothetical protein DF182_27010 [Chitinophaga flava]|uniref:histidine kinase n=2 Tax=Chitinophaga flava TaxID=2259036 RepID=A0A365XVD7_9BACT|nr:hypothetical protein DF182_27010 [Chitinophaga flava]